MESGRYFSAGNTTGAATHVGAFTAGGGGMNALVGNGASLLGASAADNNLFTINPATAAAAVTGVTQPGVSAGDLTFAGGALYASQVDPANGFDMLVNATTGTKIADFTAGGGHSHRRVWARNHGRGQCTQFAGTEAYSVNLSHRCPDPVWATGAAAKVWAKRSARLSWAGKHRPRPEHGRRPAWLRRPDDGAADRRSPPRSLGVI